MKEQLAKATAKAIKEITLSDIYDAIGQVKQRQEEDFRYLTQRIDSLSQKVDSEVGQVRQEIGQVHQRIDTLSGQINSLSGQINSVSGQLNSRLDTIIQLIIPKQKES
jgi:tetrahydromethanopterin S-methyltransferase subunit G